MVFFHQQHRLEINGGRLIPCEDYQPNDVEPWCWVTEANLHYFVIDNVDIDRPEGVLQLLDLQGVAFDGHVPLSDVVQLLA